MLKFECSGMINIIVQNAAQVKIKKMSMIYYIRNIVDYPHLRSEIIPAYLLLSPLGCSFS